MTLSRRAVFASVGMALAPIALSTPLLSSAAQTLQGPPPAISPFMGEAVLGRPEAPITIVEYASLGCSHCAAFHTTILPKIKAEFIDTGQAKLIFRDYPNNAPSLAAHMLARCAGPARFEGLKDVIFKTQAQWLNQNWSQELGKIARLAGIAPAQFDACLSNEPLKRYIGQVAVDGSNKYRVDSTPTFIFNDGAARVVGAIEKDIVDALVKLGAKRSPAP